MRVLCFLLSVLAFPLIAQSQSPSFGVIKKSFIWDYPESTISLFKDYDFSLGETEKGEYYTTYKYKKLNQSNNTFFQASITKSSLGFDEMYVIWVVNEHTSDFTSDFLHDFQSISEPSGKMVIDGVEYNAYKDELHDLFYLAKSDVLERNDGILELFTLIIMNKKCYGNRMLNEDVKY